MVGYSDAIKVLDREIEMLKHLSELQHYSELNKKRAEEIEKLRKAISYLKGECGGFGVREEGA